MNQTTLTANAAISPSLAASAPAFAALLLGLFVVWGAGFAQPNALHNATHDTRHAFALPCH